MDASSRCVDASSARRGRPCQGVSSRCVGVSSAAPVPSGAFWYVPCLWVDTWWCADSAEPHIAIEAGRQGLAGTSSSGPFCTQWCRFVIRQSGAGLIAGVTHLVLMCGRVPCLAGGAGVLDEDGGPKEWAACNTRGTSIPRVQGAVDRPSSRWRGHYLTPFEASQGLRAGVRGQVRPRACAW